MTRAKTIHCLSQVLAVESIDTRVRFPELWPADAGLMRADSTQGSFKEALAEAKLAPAQAPDELNRQALTGTMEKLRLGPGIN